GRRPARCRHRHRRRRRARHRGAPRRGDLRVMKLVRRWGRLALLVPLVFMTACAKDAPQDFLEPEGKFAKKIDKLQDPVFLIAGIVIVIVTALIIYCVFKFRADPDDDELPEQIHGNFRLEIGWTILPALVLAAISALTLPVIFD